MLPHLPAFKREWGVVGEQPHAQEGCSVATTAGFWGHLNPGRSWKPPHRPHRRILHILFPVRLAGAPLAACLPFW